MKARHLFPALCAALLACAALVLAPFGCGGGQSSTTGGATCEHCPEPSGWTVVEWLGSCCYRANPCLTEKDEGRLYDDCKAQDPSTPFPVLCGGQNVPQGCVPFAGNPTQQCAEEGTFGVYCCSNVVP